MKLYLDTNIIVDVLLRRMPFCVDSAAVLELCQSGRVDACFSSLSVWNVVYLLRKTCAQTDLQQRLLSLAKIVDLVDVTAEEMTRALRENKSDFEDTVQMICAQDNGADIIVTRDKSGFSSSSVPVMTPTEFLEKGVEGK